MAIGDSQQPAAAGAEPVHKLTHDGKGGELFVIFLVNLALTVVTLGIYRFWGKTRIRQYVWSHTSLLGERLEYTGRGIEMFLGFLFALVVIWGPIIGVYTWIILNAPQPGEQVTDAQAMALLVGIGLIYLILLVAYFLYYVALFAAYRYRASRTSWYGIKGGMEGSSWVYGFLGAGLGILNGLSLGWTKPWADSVVFQYRLGRTWFGDKKFDSSLDAQGLYPPYALAWIGTAIVLVIGIVIAVFTVMDLFQKMGRTGILSPSEQLSIQLVFGGAYLGAIITYQLVICWYKAALVRNIAKKLSFGPVRFSANVTGGDVFRLRVPNFFLMTFTLGFAYPYVVLRTARFIERHVEFHGDIETAAIGQNTGEGPWYGEGLMEFLGVGMI